MASKSHKSKPVQGPPRLWYLLVALFVLGVIAYWNSFDVPFVFDDLLTVQRNAGVQLGEFTWNPSAGRWLLYLTFTLNSIWSGQQVWSYHAVNLVLHVIDGVLVFFLAELAFARTNMNLRRARIWACLAGCFFLVHPLQTESVTYISSRSELLSTAFYLVALLMFARWPEERIGFLLGLLVAIPFALGISAKETVITLPATVFLYDFIFIAKGNLRSMLTRWRFYAVFIIGGAAAIYQIATVSLKGSIGSSPVGNLSVSSYFLTQLRVVSRYVYLVFFPIRLNLQYDIKPSTSLFEPYVIASLFFLAAILASGWFLRKRQPIVAFSIFWFFLTLAPTSSFVPILDVIFEHRLYLPLAGVCLSFPVFVEYLSTQLRSRVGYALNLQLAAVLLLGVMTSATIYRNYVWEDSVRLFSDVVSKSPHKARAYNALALAYFQKAEYDKGLQVIQKAIEANPENRGEFSDNLANTLLKAQRYDDAIQLFEEAAATEKRPAKLSRVYNNLGMSYWFKWNQLKERRAQMPQETFREEGTRILDSAGQAFRKSLELDPGLMSALDFSINVAAEFGTMDRLDEEAHSRLRTRESFGDLYTVGKIAFLKQDFKTADEYFERAEALNKEEKILYFNHGFDKERLGQPLPAIEKYTKAIRLDTMFSEARFNVGLIYQAQKDYKNAIDNFSAVLQFDPKNILANVSIARVYASTGNKEAARQHLQTVLNASPGNPIAMQTWKELGF